jgi:putative tryptophan/tyrosine transport system substrate-binding protein
MRRREFLGLFGGLSATIVSATARAGETLKRVALVSVGSTPVTQMHEGSTSVYFRTFFEELRRLGYVEGKNLVVLRFTSGGQSERIPDTAREIVAAAPDVIFAFTSRMVQQLKKTTTSIPIVGYTADPISFGIVEDLSHPGKNFTGVATEASSELDGKRLSLFREFAPRASRVAVLATASYWSTVYGDTFRDAAGRLNFTIVGEPVGDPASQEAIERTFARIADEHADLLVIPDLPENNAHLRRIVELSIRENLPTVAASRLYVTAGALMSYAADPVDLVRRAAAYVDRILKGERPGDLPVYRASRYELIINRNTAEKLNLVIPPILETAADEIISN